jgi:hypothetical protein
MDANINNFVTWLQGHEDEFPPFSNELIDTTAKAVEEGGYSKAREAIISSKADAREKLGMEVILDQLESSGVDKEKGSFLVRRIDNISKSSGWDEGGLGWHT